MTCRACSTSSSPLSSHQDRYGPTISQLSIRTEDVGRVVHAHDQRARPQHVVGVGHGDEEDGGQVVDEHEDEVLAPAARRRRDDRTGGVR
ncbi:hypothetical protein EYF80_051373 [Liparis tanakae]|uniref:Uncharacterized protein n=1 Tax=Liparis tanakae TaxID=230148 RepID=A0A4Z2FC22_9TELE|nr:hypothetical protein EYF80_051373 [Liparis tanakae]